MRNEFKKSLLIFAGILTSVPAWAGDYYVASGGMFRRVSYVERREKEKEKAAFKMGLCVGQMLVSQQISIPLPQAGQPPTALSPSAQTALQSDITACLSQMYGAQNNPGNSNGGAVNTNPGNGPVNSNPGNGPINSPPASGTAPVNGGETTTSSVVPGSDTSLVQGAVVDQSVISQPIENASLVQSGLNSVR